MVRPGARTAVLLVSVVLATLFAVPVVGSAGATETPSSACPSQGGTQQHMAESLTVRVAVNGVTVGGLWGHVTPGSTVDVSVVVPPGCPARELTLASYHSPVAGFSVDQWLADHQTRTIAGTGAREFFQVQVPDCYFQVDFAYGGVITDFRRGMYGPRLIGSDFGGTRTCEQLPPPQPGPSPSPSPTPSTPRVPSPSPSPESSTSTPSPSPTPSTPRAPSPSPSAESSTPSPSPTPVPSATPTESVTVTSPRSTPAPQATAPTSGVLGVSTAAPSVAPAPATPPRVVAAPAPSPQAAPTPSATVRVAGGTQVARLATTGIPGSLFAVVALLFGTAGVLLLVSARLRGGRARDRG